MLLLEEHVRSEVPDSVYEFIQKLETEFPAFRKAEQKEEIWEAAQILMDTELVKCLNETDHTKLFRLLRNPRKGEKDFIQFFNLHGISTEELKKQVIK